MFVFVGLGNIGSRYQNTPHNAGFLFADMLREYLGYDTLFSVDEWSIDKLVESQVCFARSKGEKRAIIAKPTTLMNASGRAVRNILKNYNATVTDLVVIHDDLDLKLGEFKIQKGVGPKGHNGIISIVNGVGTTDFLRVRLGIETRQTPEERSRLAGEDFVLKPYSESELVTLSETIADAVKSLRSIIQI